MDGVRVLAGPSAVGGASSVLAELRVSEGDWLEEGQVLAVLDDYALRAGQVLKICTRPGEQIGPAGIFFLRLFQSSKALPRSLLEVPKYNSPSPASTAGMTISRRLKCREA